MATPTVLLVNPNQMRPPIGPLGLECAASALLARGYRPELCDLTFAEDWRGALTRRIEETQPGAVLFTIRNIDDAYFASQDFILERTAVIIGSAREATSAPVVLGGVGFSMAPEPVLAFTGADYGAAGDAEDALPDLLDCLAAGDAPADVTGAVWRDADGTVRCTGHAYADVADRPAPSRRFADNRRYFREGGQAGLETKRGCPNACVYCVEPFAKGARARLRTPGSVAAEFRDLLEQGIDVVHLCDSEFNVPVAHAQAVCDGLVHAGLGDEVRWYAYASPHPFTRELAQAMKRAGCAGINFGADHAAPDMLRALGRPYGPEALKQAAEACRDADIEVMFDMLFGGPGETAGTIERALDHVRTLPVKRAGLSCGVRLYPNTPLAKQVAASGPLKNNPCLHGTVTDNDNLLRPVFYVSEALGTDIHRVVSRLVDGDARFLHADPSEQEGNYNYNDNSVLENAIRGGERGAYWDILRRLEEKKGKKPREVGS